jgi:hypothetical protein
MVDVDEGFSCEFQIHGFRIGKAKGIALELKTSEFVVGYAGLVGEAEKVDRGV